MNSGDPVSPRFKPYWISIVGTVERLFTVSCQSLPFVKAQLFLAFDLYDLAVMDGDLDRAVPYIPDNLGDL